MALTVLFALAGSLVLSLSDAHARPRLHFPATKDGRKRRSAHSLRQMALSPACRMVARPSFPDRGCRRDRCRFERADRPGPRRRVHAQAR